ncbi:hypothetical protein DL93DRAFT_181449 [Clavulina sp. PMI_390]|nr:hypothetical protein DL93DRAFT_181449 [Clavulina sp. PMI_390]
MAFDDPTKLFITHMHLDHCIGIPVLLRDMLSRNRRSKDPIEIFGPIGLRELIRTVFRLTSSTILRDDKYQVHELITPQESPTPCHSNLLHYNELPGRDIVCDQNQIWDSFCTARKYRVSAAPMTHRVPCLGYVFEELEPPTDADKNSIIAEPRKIVILGDTSDASAIRGIAQDADLLVHESTFAAVDPNGDENAPQFSRDFVTEKAIKRGHSTAEMAGRFAKDINARTLALNHFSARYPGTNHIMRKIEAEAAQSSGLQGHHIRAAWDMLSLRFGPSKSDYEWVYV